MTLALLKLLNLEEKSILGGNVSSVNQMLSLMRGIHTSVYSVYKCLLILL